jgi:hypothetical protein
MIKLLDILREAKQAGTLYHYTTILSLLKILDSNVLGDESLGKYATVSLTRDKNFHKRTSIIPTECCIVIDGDKLSNNYKIVPYQWNTAHFSGKKSTDTGKIEDQMEEEVQGSIKGVSKYIKEIIIYELELDPLPFDDDFTYEASKIIDKPSDEITANDIIEWIEKKGYKVSLA